jgi:hypothetical protein
MSFLWTIWNERNKIIFQNKKHSSIRVLGNSIISLVKHWCRPGLPRFGPLPTYLVSDTHPIWVRVRFAYDTHLILQLAYQSILTTPIRPDTPRYALDMPPIRLRYALNTSMIFFQNILVDSVKNTPSIIVDMPRYSFDTSPSEIYIMSFVLL